MKTLVTGGAGFIGSNIVKFLLDDSYEVRVFDNFSTGHEENLKPFSKIEIIRGDIRDKENLNQALEGVDIVFHLAACVGNIKSLSDPIFDSDVNVLGTLNLLEAARKMKVSKIVYSSSAAVYGEPHKIPISEDHPLNPDSPYGVSKLAAEKHCMWFSKVYNIDIIGLRYFNVYGINQRYDAYGNVIPIFANLLSKGEPLTIYGDGQQTRDFVNVQDVARANLLAARAKDIRGIFNIANGTSRTINDLAKIIQDVAGISVPVKYAAPRKGEVKHSLADINEANRTLGYKPSISIEKGLKEYLAWIRSMPMSFLKLL